MQRQQVKMQSDFSLAVRDMQSTLLSEFRAERMQFQKMMEKMFENQKETSIQKCPEPRTSTPIVS